jgi:prolipoprotein diacylglyceryltransferase
MDRLVITVCFAGAFIRFGNLFNSEIYGNVTDLPWGFVFERNGETLPKHPTQLYEAFSYILLGLGLLGAYRYRLEKMYRGEFFGIFLIVLFGMRFIIEFVKQPQVGFEEGMALNMGQLLSIPFVVAGVVILLLSLIRKKPAQAIHSKPQKKQTHYAHSI